MWIEGPRFVLKHRSKGITSKPRWGKRGELWDLNSSPSTKKDLLFILRSSSKTRGSVWCVWSWCNPKVIHRDDVDVLDNTQSQCATRFMGVNGVRNRDNIKFHRRAVPDYVCFNAQLDRFINKTHTSTLNKIINLYVL